MSIDMIVFGEDWGSHPSSTQHLMSHLMQEQQILWVNSLGLRRPRLTQRDMKRAWDKLRGMFEPVDQSGTRQYQKHDMPHIVNPRAIPWPDSKLARALNTKLLQQRLLPLLPNARHKAPLLWTSLPSAVDVVGTLGERAVVYYCGDDFSALEGVDHQPVSEMEQELVEKSQLVIAASSQLAQKFPAHKTIVLSHGVDCDLFGTQAPRATDLPEGPVAGFYGSLAGWFDQTLFIEVTRKLPHWTFVLIGPANTDISRLLAQPNVRWLGPKPHHLLPQYSQHWDVSLLPFLCNKQIEACNPLKLREYLAAGSPVVTTDFPALNGYQDLIKITNTAEYFAGAIDSTYQNTKHKALLRQFRQQRVSKESWSSKAIQLKKALEHLVS